MEARLLEGHKETTVRLFIPWMLVVAVGAAEGCRHPDVYWSDRLLDLRDCTTFQFGFGWSVPVNAGIEVTPFLPVGIGYTAGPDGWAESYGWVGRYAGRAVFLTADFPLNFDSPNGRGPFLGGTYYRDYTKHGWNRRRYGRINAHFGVLMLLYVAIDVKVIEFIDFLVGFTTLDLCGDDWEIPNGEGGDPEVGLPSNRSGSSGLFPRTSGRKVP